MKRIMIVCALLVMPILVSAQSKNMSQPPAGQKQRPPGMSHRHGGNAGFARGDFLKRLESEDPEEFKRLQALRENDPEGFRKEMRGQIEKRVAGFIKQRSGKLDSETRELGETYLKAKSEEEKTAIKAELKTKVYESFDMRLEGQKKLIAHLEAKLEELKQQVEAREKNRETICQKRVNSLIENPKLRW